MSQSHKLRYSYLIQGDNNGADKFEKIMQMFSDTILKYGPSIDRYKEATKKERKEILEIIDKTKELIATIQPSV